ncbi:DUF3024 domain-containing protein [Iamia sp.]|uniref:DUF3024 domain-containing protein n=1 Tax=Iamia sp. TaxID=2722710 RepID=UPI002BF79160|nr:DUF3024 domain-containing protein [Iamia sp.]HXH56118.1 DUF3024 domain-containing protein [Iamia sp.]
MALPETDVARVRRWVAAQNERIGEHIHEMRVEMDVDPRALTILDCRPPWREDFGPGWTRQEIARLRYTGSSGVWTLHWPDRNSKFHRYGASTRSPQRRSATPWREGAARRPGWRLSGVILVCGVVLR